MTAATSDSGSASSVIDRGPDVHQEHDDDDDDEGGAFDEGLEQVVERLFDEVGLPEQVAMDLHALRQRALDVVERRVDALGQLQRVHRGLLLDADDDRRPRVVRALAALDRRAFAHRARRRGPARAPRRSSSRVTAAIASTLGEAADAAHQILLPLRDLEAGGRVPIRGRQRLFDLCRRVT